MNLESHPRLHFAHLPSPLELMPRLSEHLGGPAIYVKRDDCTGLATGGNKTRKLEFLMADAQAQGATAIITQGAVQSNHARQTAAISAKLGLPCHILLEERVADADSDYYESGNVFLDQLYGATLSRFPADTDMDAAMEARAEELRAAGERPYVIPGGGSNPIGALGYVVCAQEVVEQGTAMDLQVGSVIHGTGSTGTQAGLVVGFAHYDPKLPVLGISVRQPEDVQVEKVFDLATRTAEHVGTPGSVSREDILVNDEFVGPGYGLPTDEMIEAVRLTAQLEGILLDPVYSGKGMAGLIGLVRRGHFDGAQNLIFVHTGGSAGLFGYRHTFQSPPA